MDELITFFQTNPKGILFLIVTTIIGFIVTVVAGTIQVISFKKQLDSEKEEGDIRKILRTNLSAKKKEIDKIETEINRIIDNKTKLNEEVKNEIPKRAKVLFLKDQIEMTIDKITHQFEIYNNLTTELKNLDSNIPSQLILENEIVEKIKPFHLEKIKKEKLIKRSLIAGIILLVISVLPFLINLMLLKTDLFGFTREEQPLFRFLEVISLLCLGYYLLYLMKGKSNRRFKVNKISRLLMNIIFIALGLFAIIAFLLFLSEGFYNHWNYSIEGKIIFELQVFFGYLFLSFLISQAIMTIKYQIKVNSFWES